ncbi:MAG: decaprenyl-phosphate phosphoribosyltransferase [Gammaproteobacteria bacterium]|nr:decaprenyl-phosphate phosphoribosyltransferase [Gammaproteobacteria bacterium]
MDYTTSPFYRLGLLKTLPLLMRPKQWIKNGFVWMPLIFSSHFLDAQLVQQTCLAFVLFCLAASSAYIINDIQDIDEDRLHPIKSTSRPLASGLCNVSNAYCMLCMIYCVLIFGFTLNPALILPITSYLILNLAYTWRLKYIPVVDIFTIAIGFVLRIYVGAVAIQVHVSAWMFVTTLCLALYLATIKRRQELLYQQTQTRKVLEQYTLPLIEKYADLSALSAVMFYSLFVMSTKPALILTIPLTLFGLFRYWFLIEKFKYGESPTDIVLEDWQLALTVIVWLSTCIYFLWPTGL